MALIKRLKSLFLALSVTAALQGGGAALAAGTTPLSLVQQFDSSGAPLAGCQLYFFVAGTVATPQNAYQDFGLTTALGNPITCDQSGRVPQHWLADGLIHIRLTDSAGLVYVDTTMQVLGPSSGGGGGGGTVDPTTVMSTGDLKAKYGTGPLAGFVRLNGLTIGNATSGATERANADTQAAFIYLYGVDPNLVVSGGRTGNALNDFNSNKTIALPDWRGRALAALDDMGNSAAGRLTNSYFGATATTLGASGGGESFALTLAQLPSGITSANTAAIALSVTSSVSNIDLGSGNFTAPANPGSVQGVNGTGPVTSTGNIAIGSAAVTSNNTSGSAHRTVQPTMLATFYMKL